LESEPADKIIERFSSPVLVTQLQDDADQEQLRIQLVESKKRKLVELHKDEKKWDTDYTLHLPLQAIHDVLFVEPKACDNYMNSVKLRLLNPPDVFSWEVDYEAFQREIDRMYNWEVTEKRFRCRSCKELGEDETQCQACLSTMLSPESPGAACTSSGCNDKTCYWHPERDIFKGNCTSTWINPLIRPSFLNGRKRLVRWKVHCRTFNEPHTHLLQYVGHCWVWVLTFHNGQPMNVFKNGIRFLKSEGNGKRDSAHNEEKELQLNSSNQLVQNRCQLSTSFTYRIGIQLWPAHIYWPNARTILSKYVQDEKDSLLRYQDGLNRFDQLYGLQALLACFPAPIVREELRNPCADSKDNRFLAALQTTYLKDGSNKYLDPTCFMLSCLTMCEKYNDYDLKYVEWDKRHHCQDSEKQEGVDLWGKHPEATLWRCSDMYSTKTYEEDQSLMSGTNKLPKKVWIKNIYVTPTRIDYRISCDEACRLFVKNVVNKDYCAKVHFQTDLLAGKGFRKANFWVDDSGFAATAKVLMGTRSNGIGIPMLGGFSFHHMCYSDKQVKMSTYWAYAQGSHPEGMIAYRPKLTTADDVMNACCQSVYGNEVNRQWEKVTRVGERMAISGQSFSAGFIRSKIIEMDNVFFLKNESASIGCGLVLDSYMEDNPVAENDDNGMIWGNFNGLEGLWAVVPKELLTEMISRDQRSIQEIYDDRGSFERVSKIVMVLPEPVKKLMFVDKDESRLEVKSYLNATCCKTNRWLVGCLHEYGANMWELNKCAKVFDKWLKKIVDRNEEATFSFLEENRDLIQLSKFQQYSKDETNRERFYDTLINSMSRKVNSVCSSYLGIKRRLEIILTYPNVCIRGVPDFTGVLGPGEVFLKTRVLDYSLVKNHSKFDWTCPICENINQIDVRCRACVKKGMRFKQHNCQGCSWLKQTCQADSCGAKRLCFGGDYMVFEGDVGLLRNRSLNPSTYYRAKAVYNKHLDKLFQNCEVLLFCGKKDGNFLSNLYEGNIKGEDLLVITDEGLLPARNRNYPKQRVQEEAASKKLVDLDIEMSSTDFFIYMQQVTHRLSILSDYYEAWTNKNDGIVNEQCLELARLCSLATDFATDNQILNLHLEHNALTKIKFPDYLGYPSSLSTVYKDSIKTKLSGEIQIPDILKKKRSGVYKNGIWIERNGLGNPKKVRRWYSLNFGERKEYKKDLNVQKGKRYCGLYCEPCEQVMKNIKLYHAHLQSKYHKHKVRTKTLERYGIKSEQIAEKEPEKLPALKPSKPERQQPQRKEIIQRQEVPLPKSERAQRQERAVQPEPIPVDCSSESDVSEDWTATLGFQYLENREWVYCDDDFLNAKLNNIWHIFLNRKKRLKTCRWENKVFDLEKKRRYGRSRPRPLRWGTVEILDRSPTAHYVDFLYEVEKNEILLREKVDKFCGFISEPQQPPHTGSIQRPQHVNAPRLRRDHRQQNREPSGMNPFINNSPSYGPSYRPRAQESFSAQNDVSPRRQPNLYHNHRVSGRFHQRSSPPQQQYNPSSSHNSPRRFQDPDYPSYQQPPNHEPVPNYYSQTVYSYREIDRRSPENYHQLDLERMQQHHRQPVQYRENSQRFHDDFKENYQSHPDRWRNSP